MALFDDTHLVDSLHQEFSCFDGVEWYGAVAEWPEGEPPRGAAAHAEVLFAQRLDLCPERRLCVDRATAGIAPHQPVHATVVLALELELDYEIVRKPHDAAVRCHAPPRVADYLSFAHALDEDGLAIQQSDVAVHLNERGRKPIPGFDQLSLCALPRRAVRTMDHALAVGERGRRLSDWRRWRHRHAGDGRDAAGFGGGGGGGLVRHLLLCRVVDVVVV